MKRSFPQWIAGARPAATDRRALWATALAAAALLVAAVAGGETGSAVARGGAVVAALAFAAALARRRAAAPIERAAIALLERQPLGKDSGLALVEVGPHRLLVGYGPSGVSLVARVPPPENAP